MSLNVSPAQIIATSSSPLLAIAPGWRRVRLGDVATVVNGFPFPSRGFNGDGIGTPVIRIRDVGKNRPSTWFQGPANDAPHIAPGEIVLGMDGDFRVARWPGPLAVLNQRVCCIRITRADVMDERFLLVTLPGYLDAINRYTSSVTVKHLSSRTVADLPLPLPSLDEQHRIVTIVEEQFSRLDAVEAQLRNAKRRTQLLEDACFALTLRADAPMRPLGEIAHTSSGGTPSRSNPHNYGGTIPWVKSGELRDSAVWGTDEYITELGLRSSSTKIVKRGALLIAMYGATVGKLGVLEIDAATNQAVCAIQPHDPDTVKFLRYCLRALRPQLLRAAKGGAQPNISQGIIRKLHIPMPSAEERERIVASVSTAVEVSERLDAAIVSSLKKITQARAVILRDAFNGRLSASAA